VLFLFSSRIWSGGNGRDQSGRFAIRRSAQSMWEGQKTDLRASPAGMLERRAFAAAGRATCAPTQPIARRVRSPPDDERHQRHRRVVVASLAPHPKPRMSITQLRERRARTRRLPLCPIRRPALGNPSRHRPRIEVGRLAAHDSTNMAVRTSKAQSLGIECQVRADCNRW
jgi:hypothetical protein